MRLKSATIAAVFTASIVIIPSTAKAWGNEGHMIIGHIAYPLLTPTARKQVDALLEADQDMLTAKDFPTRTTWADKWRDSDRHGKQVRYKGTRQWHFVDIEIADEDFDKACFNHPPLPLNTPASNGPADSCVVDKVNQFIAELKDPNTIQAERILALKFLMHFIGDIHQPLHSADNQDRGGNNVPVLYGKKRVPDKLHAYWDVALVKRFGTEANAVADLLMKGLSKERVTEWSAGEPRDWAMESFTQAKEVVYDFSGLNKRHFKTKDAEGEAYVLTEVYDERAMPVVRTKLMQAGLRLAMVLNEVWQ